VISDLGMRNVELVFVRDVLSRTQLPGLAVRLVRRVQPSSAGNMPAKMGPGQQVLD